MGWNQGYCSIVVEILFIKQNPSSSVAPLTCGVPQSSILGLLSFYVYITYISPIFITTVMQTTYKCMLHTGVSYCQKWLFQNIVKVNKNKTDIIILGSPKSVIIFQKHLNSLSTNVKPVPRNLRVIFDSDLSFWKTSHKVFQSCFLSTEEHLKNKTLSLPDFEKVIHAFLSFLLGSCSPFNKNGNTRSYQPCLSPTSLVTVLQMIFIFSW